MFPNEIFRPINKIISRIMERNDLRRQRVVDHVLIFISACSLLLINSRELQPTTTIRSLKEFEINLLTWVNFALFLSKSLLYLFWLTKLLCFLAFSNKGVLATEV